MSVDDPRTVTADDDHDAYQQHLADRMRDHEPVSLHVARAALRAYDDPTSPEHRAALLRAIRDDLRTGRPQNAVDPSSVAAFPDAAGPSQDPFNENGRADVAASPGPTSDPKEAEMERMMPHRADTRIDVDEQPDGWYVVRVEDGDDTDVLAGPFDTEAIASRVTNLLVMSRVNLDAVDRIDGWVKAHSTGDWA